MTAVQHVVNCDAMPFILPNGWKVEEHKKGSQLKLEVSKIKLHLSPNQMGGKVIEGNDLRRELATEPVLNANVLDYLLAHPELIPEDWKRDEKDNTRYIFFWGTVYRYFNGDLHVRCLCWYDWYGKWDWSYRWLVRGWNVNDPAATSTT